MRWLAFLLFALLLSLPAFAQYSNPSGGGSTSIVSGTTPITGGGDTQVCFNDAGTLACGDAGCVYNKTTNTLTCDTFAGALTGTASLATALAANPANCAAASFPLGIAANGAAESCTTFSSSIDSVVSGRRRSWCANTVSNGTSLTCVGQGGAAPSTIGTSSIAASDNSTFTRIYVTETTKSSSPTSGDAAGLRGPSTTAYITNAGPRVSLRIATPATITTMRIWAGISDNTLTGIARDSTTGGTFHFVAFGFDTGASPNPTHLYVCAADGSTQSCTDTTVVVQASTEYVLTLDFSSSSSTVTWTVNGTSSTHSTNLPTSTTGMGWTVSATTLTAGQRAVWIANEWDEQN